MFWRRRLQCGDALSVASGVPLTSIPKRRGCVTTGPQSSVRRQQEASRYLSADRISAVSSKAKVPEQFEGRSTVGDLISNLGHDEIADRVSKTHPEFPLHCSIITWKTQKSELLSAPRAVRQHTSYYPAILEYFQASIWRLIHCLRPLALTSGNGIGLIALGSPELDSIYAEVASLQ